MIVVLHSPACLSVAETIAADLANAFNGHVSTSLISADSSASWPSDASWDDLLLVVYDGKLFADPGNRFIADYSSARKDARLLPVAVDLDHKKPPSAAEAIKALEYDDLAKGKTGRLVRRVGCMLSLLMHGRDSRIFISYRATDGKKIAEQLHDRFSQLGHRPYLDEARDLDGETNIRPGEAVQQQIDEALAAASLVLLLDTPDAPSSYWISQEVEIAEARLLPILPIYFKGENDRLVVSRFPSLRALQRTIPMEQPNPALAPPLTDEQLDRIVTDAEQYQCEVFQRKCRVPFLVEKEFLSHGFDWKELDKRLLMFESLKRASKRLQTKVLSHCSIFEQVHIPAVGRFRQYLQNTGRSNYSLFIYDGDILSPVEIDAIVRNQNEDFIILHHQELATLISSNFTALGAA